MPQLSVVRLLVEIVLCGGLGVARVGCEGKVGVEGKAFLRRELRTPVDFLDFDEVEDVADISCQFPKVRQISVWIALLDAADQRIPARNMRIGLVASIDRQHLIQRRAVVVYGLTAFQHASDVLVELFEALSGPPAVDSMLDFMADEEGESIPLLRIQKIAALQVDRSCLRVVAGSGVLGFGHQREVLQVTLCERVVHLLHQRRGLFEDGSDVSISR
ncbi:hypothetical protein [Variovorax sp. Sphag1AA]|uniref:hypothetical protein n=1 Tax=Variovorax sp. Sphag1AA TaxID=2587027 RepID=UPI003908370E